MSEAAIEYDDAPADNVEAPEAPEQPVEEQGEAEQPEVAEKPEEKSFGENAADWAEAVSNDTRFEDNEFKGMKPFDPVQQKFIEQKMFARERAKRGELEEKIARLEQFEQQSQQVAENSGRPADMPEPDVWDDNYEQKMQAWKENVRAQAEWDVQEGYRQQQAEAEKWKQEQERRENLFKEVSAYEQRAEAAGIDAQELGAIGQSLATIGVNPDLEMAILRHEQGPLMSKYLASNPPLAAHLRDMDPVLAAMQLGQALPGLKSQLTRKKSPPPPPEVPEGRGAVESERGPKGATYE